MIDRHYWNGPIDLRCDGCASGYVETGVTDIAEALVIAKREGWVVRPVGETKRGTQPSFGHFCDECVPDAPWERADAAPRVAPRVSKRALR